MRTATTKAVEAKRQHYMRLESASNYQLFKSLWFRVDNYVYTLLLGMGLGLLI